MNQYQKIVEQMSLKEKAALLTGKGMWRTQKYDAYGIPELMLSDGPSGMRTQEGKGDWLGINKSMPATCFPSGATIANSWDLSIAEEVANAIGEEAASFGVNVVLGPGVNVKRSPLCGRNFEYFSEDPYLSGKMGAAYVRGIQKNKVAACMKHYAANSQETRRMANDSVMDERTLREIYTYAFELAIKEAAPKAIMSGYNKVNGVYANENRYLLQELLREEFGFNGFVVSDWGGSNDHVEGVRCGSHLEMPGNSGATTRELVRAVKKGKLSEKVLDQRVEELLQTLIVLGMEKGRTSFDAKAHHEIARKAAAESIVLLKNDNEILPLEAGTKVAVIGEFAELPRYQGAGSALVNAISVDTTVEQLEKKYSLKPVGYCAGYRRNQKTDPALLREAEQLAEKADVVLLYAGLDEASESEGFDRTHMRMPENQLELIDAVCEKNRNVIVILSAGSVVEMPWISKVKGVLHSYLGGEAVSTAVLDIVTGKVNPSGKLNETYPEVYEDTPTAAWYPSAKNISQYREGIFVGYRYYDTAEAKVRFPFGYGLSYTKFKYLQMKAEKDSVSVTVSNIGSRAGAEVVQIYVRKESSEIFRAKHELKGFSKVFLQPGETKTVKILLDEKAFSYYNPKTKRWETEEGQYVIEAASNSRDIRLTEQVYQEGTVQRNPYEGLTEFLDSYYQGRIKNVSDEEFSCLLQRDLPVEQWKGKLERNDTFSQLYYARNPLGRFVYRKLNRMLQDSIEKGEANLDIAFFFNMPFRGLVNTTHGIVTSGVVDGFVRFMNGQILRGIGQMIGCMILRR
ncbi:MAG: glycoside hydrolase family 3 C-terminal domain-containing protein [Eubacteriales bacterium]|nr:glycoside hydrolase family 3 C-terminal domain-containing protein [Eubacteriales bacterium]